MLKQVVATFASTTPLQPATDRLSVTPTRLIGGAPKLVLSYQPRAANALSSNVSWNRTTPPPPPDVTVTAALPLLPSLVAVMVTGPAATPVTNPLPLTVANAVLPLAQVTTRPESGLPPASFGVAVNCWRAPTTTLALAGLTVTVATGAVLAVVVPLATFESPPNTAFTFSVPRNATTWN